ncbi:MAG: outer membrane protein assembly factor BamA, partial [Bacteroidales bacterium]|nr:outer membrane protein assembly factor BamA [Bacteroidales bacterium]
MKSFPIFLILAIALVSPFRVLAQDNTQDKKIVVDYNLPKTYVIGGIDVTGIKYLGKDQILSLTGLSVGDTITIPGEDLSAILKRIFLQRYFSDVGIYIDSLQKDTAFLRLNLVERPRVSRWDFEGIKSGEKADLNEKLKLRRGSELSEYAINSSSEIIRKYYVEKGFLQTTVDVVQVQDTLIKNAVKVTFKVDRKSKVKVQKIRFIGNDNVKSSKLASAMKKTKDMRILNFFSTKKFNEKEYPNDKKLLLQAYGERGYR